MTNLEKKDLTIKPSWALIGFKNFHIMKIAKLRETSRPIMQRSPSISRLKERPYMFLKVSVSGSNYLHYLQKSVSLRQPDTDGPTGARDCSKYCVELPTPDWFITRSALTTTPNTFPLFPHPIPVKNVERIFLQYNDYIL